MWSLLSFDYVKGNNSEKCLKHLQSFTQPGDVVVFHDNGKPDLDLCELVGKYIDFCRKHGYNFGRITSGKNKQSNFAG